MRAIVRRLAKLEVRLVARESAESARLRERLHRAYERVGRPYPETGQLTADDAWCGSLGERILLARRRSQAGSRS